MTASLLGAGGQAEDLAGFRVEPRVGELHAFGGLNLQVAAVRLGQLRLGDSDKSVVHVHELGHHR